MNIFNENAEIYAEVCQRLKKLHHSRKLGFVSLVQKDPLLAHSVLREIRAEKAQDLRGLRIACV